jgi:hypothetical protein
MLSSKERWILTAAWATMIAVGVGSFLVIHARTESAMAELAKVPTQPGCGWTPKSTRNITMEKFWRNQEVISPVRVPSNDYVACLVPTIIVPPLPPPPPPKELLPPVALYSGTFEMDRATVSWKLQPATLNPTAKFKQMRSDARAIVIHRRCDTGEVQRIAVLDPKATSFEDRDVEPNHSYCYWILVRAEKGLTDRAGHAPVLEEEGEGAAQGTVPAWHKVKLIGGDRDRAFFTVESYQAAAGKWETKRVMAVPGQPIGATGWTLEGLRFDRFTLVAEVRDDLRETRMISTKKE